MPALPSWFHRLTDILAQLSALEPSHLDRLAVETLFGVRERRARQIMAGLPGIQVGNAFAVSKEALIAWLKGIHAGEPFRWEADRRERLAETLARTRRQFAARRVTIPAQRPEQARHSKGLPPGIQLSPGQLHIHFTSPIDLAAKLFELSQAMANDWDGFVRTVQRDKPLNEM